jgi:hypothetical protein
MLLKLIAKKENGKLEASNVGQKQFTALLIESWK